MFLKKKSIATTLCALNILSGNSAQGINVIFEGINASGKTTTLKALETVLKANSENFHNINELEESPLAGILKDMLKKDAFLVSGEKFKTSIYETLLLVAHARYKEECFGRDIKRINIFDRDFMTVLAYQRYTLKKEYGSSFEEVYEAFKKIMFFQLVPVELVVYLKVPLELSIERAKLRNREEIYTPEQIDYLTEAKKYYEEELIPEVRKKGITVLELDGTASTEENVKIIYDEIKKIKLVQAEKKE